MKNHRSIFGRVRWISLIVVIFSSWTVRAAEKSSGYRAALESITGQELLVHDRVLAGEKLAGREAGSQGSAEARKYLIEQFTKYKLQPAGESGKFEQPFSSKFCNLVGMIPGRDPVLKNEYVLVEAHYDHVGFGRHGMSFDPGGLHPGADDNASGTSALVELAEAFSLLGEAPKRSILILATDAEEKGLLGSRHWASHPTVPIDKVVAGINLDMIGYLRNDILYVFGARTACGWRRLVGEQNEAPYLALEFHPMFRPNADHYPLYEKGVPVIMFNTGLHNHYHRVTDTPDKLNSEGMGRVTRLVFQLMNALAERSDRLAYRQNVERESETIEESLRKIETAPPARLGVTLDPAIDDSPDGLRILKVEPDSSASRAGLKDGDRILQLGGQTVRKIDALIGLVMTVENPTTIQVKRSGEEKPQEIPLELSGHPLRLGITWRVDDAEPGTLILTQVVPGTPAARAGLQPGDRVYQVSGRDFANEEAFLRAVSPSTDSLDLLIERNGRIQSIPLLFKTPSPEKQAA